MAWYRTLLNVFHRQRLDRDIEREMSFHLAERVDAFREQGVSRSEAERLAQRKFGNVAIQMERTRDMDIARWLETFLRNIRLSMRTLLKMPAFTATVVLTLALGIGASSAVFSAVDAVLLKPLPFPNGDELMVLRQANNKNDNAFLSTTRLLDWDRMNSTFQAISGYYTQDESEISGEIPEHLKRAFVGPRFFEVWGVAPALGRDFTEAETKFGGANAVIISDRLWRNRFGADTGVLGKTLHFGGYAYSTIGVMPPSFRVPDPDVDLWTASPVDAPYAQDRQSTWFSVIGRLKPGVTLAQARADMETVQADLGKLYPKSDGELQAQVRPMKDSTVGEVRGSLWIL
ncbi:MAG TPA: ABC transporter permease, partial [Blastocatellia bacterium]